MSSSEEIWLYFCGHNRTFDSWINNDFGHCFEQVVILVPTHALLAIISMYYIAQSRNIFSHIQFKLPWFVILRIVSVLMLLVLPLIQLLLTFLVLDIVPSIADSAVTGVSVFCWILHSIYIYRLKHLLWYNYRGPLSAIFLYLLTFVAACIQLHTVILQKIMISPLHNYIEEFNIYVLVACHLLYIFSLIPKGDRNLDSSLFSGSINISPSETEPLSSHHVHTYGTTTRAHSSVVAEDGTNCLSKLSFHWVQQLMNLGVKQNIKTYHDLFLLPKRLNTVVIEQRFTKILQKDEKKDSNLDTTENTPLLRESGIPNVEVRQGRKEKQTLLQAMHSAFGVEYYSLGILKLLADAFGFAGPILLNYLVTFMEVKGEPESHGYIYATLLFVATLLGSLCSSQFDYHVKVVGFKMRCAIITTIYKKALSVSSVSVTKFSSGQIINFMSTDTDRIVNFCPSFHAVWSLPFQIGVSLFLLHQQVGLAFLAGLGFALILIPINRWLAEKIGKLSKDMMEQKDSRVKVMNEILYGIRVVKFYAWEEHFRTRIQALREAELKSLKGRKYLDAMCVYFWATTPVLISILTFTTYSLMGNQLTAAKVFTSLSLFLMLISPLNAFPWVINGLMEAWVSLKRVQEFVCLPDLDLKQYYTIDDDSSDASEDLSDLSHQGKALSIKAGTFSWKEKSYTGHNTSGVETSNCHPSGTLMLQNINIDIHKGQFIGVIGKVGSGKSSLLNAMLAEMSKVQGEIKVHDLEAGYALASQESWIQHATVQENILFGKQLNGLKYEAVLEAAALHEDLKMLPAGDKTEVGENGVTLSGGQKARIALARALYQDKDIYLLDDPLAAVDAHVAQHLYDKCIMGLLKKKTRILCTHHTKYLQNADLVIVLDDGNIKQAGLPKDVLNSEFLQSVDDAEKDGEEMDKTTQKEHNQDDEDQCGELVGEEEKETGVVKFQVYSSYWKSVGHCLAPMILFSLFLMQGSRNVNDWWLSYWVSHSNLSASAHNKTMQLDNQQFRFSSAPLQFYSSSWYVSSAAINSTNNTSSGDDDIQFYLMVYGCLAGANSLFTLLRAFLFAYGGICAAQVLHKHLLNTLLKAPISFFDTTPIGRIINRFSSDLYSIDDALPFIMNIFLAQLYGILGTIIITCIGLPWFALLLIPLGILYYKIQQYYRHTSRELKRISSITLSPIYAHFSETVTGLVTIRAFRQTNRFRKENMDRLDINQRAQFAATAAGSWLGFRLQMMGVVMVAGIAFIAVLEHHFQTVNPGLVGLAISYALSVTNLLSGVVNSFTETEKQMVSVERAQQYIDNIPSEQHEGLLFVAASWPTKGSITFTNVKLRYRHGLPNALNGVSICTKPAEKIGIVGRTGSGKSSIFLALFRMVEIYSGEICIDGMNIQHLDLSDLRSRLAIIPQDPFLFTGTVRQNLDPTGTHDDRELWDVLERCHLKEVIERLGGLESDVSERGRHFSVGQRQLVCLARALLTKAKVLCIDEATANIDKETDKSLQDTIQTEFHNSTVLTIAHRIETVQENSDRVIVMSDGQVAEFDSPDVLLQNKHSLFYKLANRNS